MKQLVILLLALLIAAPALAGNLYKWVDKQGVVHYSDEPHPGSKQVDLPGLSSYSSKSLPSPQHNNQKSEPGDAYDTFAITSPQPDETIHANDGKVSVTVALVPQLRRGQTLVYKLDNQKAGTSRSPSITLTHVVRGTHTLSVSAMDGAGDTVAEAPPVTFHVRHHSVLNKKNPVSQFPKGPTNNNNAFQFSNSNNPPR